MRLYSATEGHSGPVTLAVRLRDEVGLVVYPRSIERALVRHREPDDTGDEVPIARRDVRR